MISIEQSYDVEKGALVIIYNNNLLRKHSRILEEEVKNLLPSDVTVEKGNTKSTRLITIPQKNSISQPMPGVMSIALSTDIVSKVDSVFQRFILKASKLEQDTLKVISLDSSLEDIKKSAEDAVSEKKDICILEDYLENENIIINQRGLKEALFKYGTNEYCDIVLSCLSGDKEELSNIKLSLIEWM